MGLIKEAITGINEDSKLKIIEEKSHKIGIEVTKQVHTLPIWFAVIGVGAFIALVATDQMGEEFYKFYAEGHVTFFESTVDSINEYGVLIVINFLLGLRKSSKPDNDAQSIINTLPLLLTANYSTYILQKSRRGLQ